MTPGQAIAGATLLVLLAIIAFFGYKKWQLPKKGGFSAASQYCPCGCGYHCGCPPGCPCRRGAGRCARL